MSVVAITALRPDDLLITDQLYSRVRKRPDLRAEASAFHELSTILTTNPQHAIQRFLELAMTLCGAGSAGLSLLDRNEAGEAGFRWEAVVGAFAPYVGTTTPLRLSACGLCLDQGRTILMARPACVLDNFSQTGIPLTEGLLVPLYDTGREPLGTIWVVSHDERRFEANDARIMEQLSVQLALALKLMREAADQEQLRQEVAAKDTLIQEVNHRVKNTIQTASSLLRLQALTSHSPEVRAALEEAQGRLTVFATVHELLYRSADSAQAIGMRSLLQSLAESLRHTFSEQSEHVRLSVNADRVSLRPDEAIPLALLANEVITNSYKHAFPDGRSGEIVLSLESGRDGTLRLTISDDGVGMASDVREGSLGLRLIHSFARQLGATLSISGGSGTTVSLTLVLPAASS